MSREPTQADLQETYDYLMDEATRILALGGSFAPFGAGIRQDGERTHVNVDLKVAESSPTDHIAGLVLGFRQEAVAGALVVAGMAFDGQIAAPDGGDEEAVIIHIENVRGEGLQILVPYSRTILSDGKISFRDPIVQSIEPEIFAASV
jgi:hypothetical protein